MNSALQTGLAVLFLLSVVGCSDTPSTPTEGGQTGDQELIASDDGKNASTTVIEQQRIDAETLASILGVHVWSFRFSGGPVRCWLEVEEVGQDTMPKRMPEGGEFVTSNNDNGEIRFVWQGSRSTGGSLDLNCNPGGGYGFALHNKAFVFDWKTRRSHGLTPTGQIRSIEASEGEELVLMTYKASEITSANDTTEPREVTLTLKAIIGESEM